MPTASAGVVLPPALINTHPVPSYPNVGHAVPAASPEALLQTQAKLLQELQQTSSLSNSDFQELFMPMLRNYAAFVHLLPGSEAHHHCGQGGLLRHGLEVAFYAGLKCEAKVFALDHTPSVRKRLEPRWRIAAMIGGLLHDMGKPLVDVGAIDETGQLVWNPHTQPLYDWLQAKQLQHYFIHWRPGARHKRHEAFTTATVYRIVPERTMQWLAEHHGHEALDAMMLALGGSTDVANEIATIVREADSDSVSRDIKESRTRLAATGMGGVRSLAARIVRAIHDQISDGQNEWRVNTPGNIIWVTTEGVFGVYPAIAREAIAALRDAGDTSLPVDAAAVIEVLGDHGYLMPNIQSGGRAFNTWKVLIRAEDRGQAVEFPIHAVRFMRDDILPTTLVPQKAATVVFLDERGNPVGPVAARPSATTTQPTDALAPGVEAPAADSAPAGAPEKPFVAKKPAAPRKPATPRPHQVDLLAPALDDSPLDDGEGLICAPPDDGEPEMPEEDEGRGDVAIHPESNADPLRDRAMEMDVRDEEMRDASHASRWPPESTEATTRWFENQHPLGEFILILMRRVREGVLKEGTDLFDINDCIHVRYPTGLDGMGMAAQELIAMLQEKGWAIRAPETPARATVAVVVNGKSVSAARFSPHLSEALRLLLPARHFGSGGRPRVDPWGPYLDSEAATHLVSKTQVKETESAWVRIGFQSYLADRAADGEAAPEPGEWAALIKQFCKLHRIKVTSWAYQHLTEGDNPFLRPMKDSATTQWTEARLERAAEYQQGVDATHCGMLGDF